MPTRLHELITLGVEDAIRSQLQAIGEGTDEAAPFVEKVRPARSTEILFQAENPTSSKRSKRQPDASFWHDFAQYPGVVIEVAYSQNKRKLDRLAEDYLFDSNANIRVVIGLDIGYGEKGSRKAVFSTWRPALVSTADGLELQANRQDKVCYPMKATIRLWRPDS